VELIVKHVKRWLELLALFSYTDGSRRRRRQMKEYHSRLFVPYWHLRTQVHVAWFTYDLAMCVYFPYMLSRAGTFIDGSKVPGKEASDQFTTWVCDGCVIGS
jgi:hypothetical protein